MKITPSKAVKEVREGIEAKVQENVEYPDVIKLIDKLGPDTPMDIHFNRASLRIDKQGIGPDEIKKIMDEWLCPRCDSIYCEGIHSIDSIGGVDNHTIHLEYGICDNGFSSDWAKEKPFEEATITYSVKQ
jgi:hypothetical protein